MRIYFALLCILMVRISQSATPADCNACSWPFKSGGVNSQGKCLTTGTGEFQDGLASTCWNSCETWGANSDTVQYLATNVWNFVDAGNGNMPSCTCYRFRKGGIFEYRAIQSNTCDYGISDANQVWGNTDSYINRDNSNKNYAVRNFAAGSRSDSVSQVIEMMETYCPGYKDEGGGAYTECSWNCYGGNIHMNSVAHMSEYTPRSTNLAYWVGDNFVEYTMNLPSTDKSFAGNNEFPVDYLMPGVTCGELNSKGSTTAARALMDEMSKRFGDVDTGLRVVSSKLDGLSQLNSNGIANILSVMKANDSAMNVKLNNVGGGGSDNGPVLEAIDGLNTAMMLEFDSMGMSISALDSGINQQTQFLKNARASDSVSSNEAYQKILDSAGRPVPGQAEVDSKLGELTALTTTGQENANSFLSGLSGFKNLPGTCSTAPTFDFDLSSVHLGAVSIDMNKYSWVFSLSRGVFRFLGAFAGIKIIMGALSMLGLSNAKRSQ